MKTRIESFAIAALFAVCSLAQTSVSTSSGPNGFIGTAHFGERSFDVRPITGAPYSGEEVSETVQTLADGTHITRTNPATKVYRDSLGRTRTERQMFRAPAIPGASAVDSPIIVEITDPVAHARYTLDTQNKVAHRQELSIAGVRPPVIAGAITRTPIAGSTVTMSGVGAAGGKISAPLTTVAGQATDVLRPKMTTEKLGTQTIEGLPTEGMRHTRTLPVGSEGNDRELTITDDMWMSTDLKVRVLSEMNDPRNGKHTQKLINISRSEPDPSLFQPPPDYTVVEEKGEFTIKWGSQQQ